MPHSGLCGDSSIFLPLKGSSLTNTHPETRHSHTFSPQGHSPVAKTAALKFIIVSLISGGSMHVDCNLGFPWSRALLQKHTYIHAYNNHRNSSLLKRKKRGFNDSHTRERERESENKQTLYKLCSKHLVIDIKRLTEHKFKNVRKHVYPHQKCSALYLIYPYNIHSRTLRVYATTLR